jgi:hypothetical protein
MNKSNQGPIQLDGDQSARLMRLFQFPPPSSLPSAWQTVASEPVIWHPVLTDIHDQVVHTISPVLVRQQAVSEGLPPTLSLILLAPPAGQSTPRMGAVNQQEVVDQSLHTPKQTL